MAPMEPVKNHVAADFDAIQARLAVAFARRESIVKSILKSSSRADAPRKIQQKLDDEDADLFQVLPAYLGLGAEIPKGLLNGDFKRKEISENERLRYLLTGKKGGLHASTPRDVQEKVQSAKRALHSDSSDEEGGRSSLGRVKKSKTQLSSLHTTAAIPVEPWRTKDLSTASRASKNSLMGHVSLECKPVSKPESTSDVKVEFVSSQQVKTQPNVKPDPGACDKSETKDESIIALSSCPTEEKRVLHTDDQNPISLLKRPTSSHYQAIKSGSNRLKSHLRKPLVDYVTDDDQPSSTASASPKLATPSKTAVTGSEWDIPDDSPVKLTKSSSKSSSNSDESEMETVIPRALVDRESKPCPSMGQVGRTVAEQEERKRLKRIKKKNAKLRRKEQQKADALANQAPAV